MKQSKPSLRLARSFALLPRTLWLLPFALALAVSGRESTNIMVKPPVPIPGGLGLYPVITSVSKTQEMVTVQWFGIQGPFQLLHSTAASSNDWHVVSQPTYASQITAPAPAGDLGFFRVLSGRPVSTAQTGGTMNYVGAGACVDCHEETHHAWSQTPHAGALNTLKAIKQDKNPVCLVCHTVGFGTPLGFESESTTPHLAGVQCENCHGPAANHVANVRDPSARPKVTVAAEVCGGCHNDFHHPTFDEWKTSAHAVETEDVAESILQQGEPRMRACGVCHAGAVRTALLKGLEDPSTPLPNRVDAAAFGVTCAVCHDPHQNGPASEGKPNPQLRNPLYSLENYSYSTSTNTSFAAQYNPNIQVCAQCHNMRGARWQDTSRPPHHSPQYNVLVGKGAYDLGQNIISAHGSYIENQCAHCHTHPHPVDNPTAENPNYTGHTFEVHFENCVECHISLSAVTRATANTQKDTKARIQSVKSLLDTWATTKAPEDLRTKYGTLAWEYNIPGQLSNPTNNATLRGPTSAEQAKVPDPIKQARMNLYLVEHDASYGVHNGDYARYLLDVASTNVNRELTIP